MNRRAFLLFCACALGSAALPARARADDEKPSDAARERWQKLSPKKKEATRERYKRWRELPPEKRDELRERWKKLTPEEKKQLRKRRGGRKPKSD